MIHIKCGSTAGADWLGQFIQVVLAESIEKRAGGECVLARLSELMFVEVVRRYLESLPEEQTGWLAGLRDRFVGRALALLPRPPCTSLDVGNTRQGNRPVALRAGGTVYSLCRPTADAIPHALAHANRGWFAVRERCYGCIGGIPGRL